MRLMVDVEFEGLTLSLEVTGELEPDEPQTWDHPGSPGGFDASSIKINGTELITDLPDEVVRRIETMAMEDLLDEEA